MTQVVSPFASKTLRAARVLHDLSVPGPKPLSLSSEQIKRARHLTWAGASLAEIHSALGLKCSVHALWNHLTRLNIRTNRARRFQRK